MFDIGFWEIAVIAVVALLVVGPNEFPTLVRNIAGWIGKLRRFLADTKNDLDQEFRKAEQLKTLLDKEIKIAEQHETLDAEHSAVPAQARHVDSAIEQNKPVTEKSESVTKSASSSSTAASSHGTTD